MLSSSVILSTLLVIAPLFVRAQTTHNVVVGLGGLDFNPPQVTAAVGDIVAFEFHPKNHTLTQSTFANPCTEMPGGVNSGFMPVAASATTFPVFSFKVNDVTPLWFYCAQTGHCQSGMVMAVNVNASSPNTFAAFQAAAMGGTASASASVVASGSSGGYGSGGYGSPTGASQAGSATTASGSASSASATTVKVNAAGKVAVNGAGASLVLTMMGLVAGLIL